MNLYKVRYLYAGIPFEDFIVCENENTLKKAVPVKDFKCKLLDNNLNIV